MYNSETKILVTGGAGFVGTNFINDLLNRGHNPKCIAVIDNMEHGTYIPKVHDQIENFHKVDIRNQYVFEKGHLDNAINIHAPGLLNKTNSKVFKDINKQNKTAVLYGNNPTGANMSFLLLYQLGYNNIKILLINNSYKHNKLITKSSDIGKSTVDINAYIKESQKNADVKPKPVKKIPKKIVPVKKKKKMPVEGGC